MTTAFEARDQHRWPAWSWFFSALLGGIFVPPVLTGPAAMMCGAVGAVGARQGRRALLALAGGFAVAAALWTGAWLLLTAVTPAP
ncbi:MAG: hypothetical protein ACTHK4_04385 [Mycobacteriales bacterium]